MSAPSANLLIVDDDTSVQSMLLEYLRGHGYAARAAGDGTAMRTELERELPDLVLLDLRLPDMSGFDVCRQLRARSIVPIIIITAQTDTYDMVAGLEAGADDYVTKPFSVAELVGRVKAVLRRHANTATARIQAPAHTVRQFGALTVDAPAREAKLDGTELELTRIEFDLLDTLTAEPRVAFSRAQLLERVWGENWFGDDHLVDVHISNLRRKLADDPRSPDFVCTVRGVGYRMGAGR